MSRVITFSRTFPSYHPRRGEATHFVEKVLRSLHDDEHLEQLYRNWEVLKSLNMYEELNLESVGKFQPKHHTIRAGHHWKVGDWFSPRVWSGRPYNSKQIAFAPDIQVKKVFDFSVDLLSGEYCMKGLPIDVQVFKQIAKNDGLTARELSDWFNQHMSGQIICWNESIEY